MLSPMSMGSLALTKKASHDEYEKAPWASAAAYRQDEKFSAYPTTNEELGTSGRWV